VEIGAVLSVCLSDHHTRDLHLNGSRYLNTFCIVQLADVSSFLLPDFMVRSLGVCPELMH